LLIGWEIKLTCVIVENLDENKWETDLLKTTNKWKLNEKRMNEFLEGNEN
jgi:hypothetical protein